MLEYLMYLVGEFVATLFPLPVLYWIARRIAELNYLFDKRGRTAVKANLRVMMPETLGEKALNRAARQTFYHFALYLAEFFRMRRIDRAYFDSRVKTEGLENVDAALKLNKGIVVVSAHYSNWELGLAYLAMCGYPAYGVVAPHRNKRVNDLFLKPRVSLGVRVISTKNAIEDGYRALRENGILCLLGDRVTTKGGVETTFFGHTAVFPKGPAKFALGANAPLVPAYIIRQPRNRFLVTFDEPISTEGLPDGDESVQKLMDVYTRRLETYIRRDPTQYEVFFRIWKDADNPA
jgi:lauroyl/myristoyl acyltransferase